MSAWAVFKSIRIFNRAPVSRSAWSDNCFYWFYFAVIFAHDHASRHWPTVLAYPVDATHVTGLFAIAVVSLAAFDLCKQFCQTRFHVMLCGATLVFLLGFSLPGEQWLALGACVLFSTLWSLKKTPASSQTWPSTQYIAWLPLCLWGTLLLFMALIPHVQSFQGLFWAGSSVMGGGHGFCLFN